jgi:phosphoserine phosphatase
VLRILGQAEKQNRKLKMQIAVFDFDETLVHLPSGIIWSRPIPIGKRIVFPFLYSIEKLFGANKYHKKLIEWLIGVNISVPMDRMNILPPVTGAVTFFNKLYANGYKMIVMSYSPEIFVSSWLSKYGLNAKIISPKIIVSNGMVQNISSDPVTNSYLKRPNTAKAHILAKMNIEPNICVGDSRQRDKVCSNYIDIRDLEPQYRYKMIRYLYTLCFK